MSNNNKNKISQQSRIPGDNGEEQPLLHLPLPPAQELTVFQLDEQKREKNRQYKAKSRNKLGWQEIESRANGGILFEEKPIEFIINDPKEGKVKGKLIWKKGLQTTQVTDLKKYGPLKKDMKNCVIVKPDGDNINRVAIPQGHIKQTKMVIFKLPNQNVGCLVEQYVGGKVADNGIVYSLIKWGDFEYHWVALDNIYEVENRRHAKRTTHYLGHEDNKKSKVPGNQGPPDMDNDSKNVLGQLYEEAKNEIVHNFDCDGRIDMLGIRLSNKTCHGPNAQKKKRDINLLLQSTLLHDTLMGNIHGRLPAVSLLAGYADPSKPLEPNLYLDELVALAPTKDNRITELGNRVTFDTVIEGNSKQQMKEEKKEEKKKTPECSQDGCTTQAHSNTNFVFCQRHDPEKMMCSDCEKYQARRRGGVCNKCFDKKPIDDTELFCQGCADGGKKIKPRKVGGFCKSCIQEKKRRMCQKCNIRPQWKEKLCYKCFNQSKNMGEKME